jgi:hypothetical protein
MQSVQAVAVAMVLGLAGIPPATRWVVVSSPSPGELASLQGVASFGPSDAWSVGSWRRAKEAQRTLIQHWDGVTWRTVQSPDTGLAYDTLNAVDGVTNDVWAVGYAAAVVDDPDQASLLVLHGTGTTWSMAPVVAPGVVSSLAAVDMLDPNDGWAVGAYRPDSRAAPEGLILHWTGAAWTQADTSALDGMSSHLTGVSGSAADDVWAVGYTEEAGGAQQSLLLHWDGQSWKRFASPERPRYNTALLGVSMVGPGDAWAVGYSRLGAAPPTPYAVHLSMGTWQPVPIDLDSAGGQLRAVVAGPNGVWAAGYQGTDKDDELMLSFDGAVFTIDGLPLPPQTTGNVTGTALRAVAATPPTGALWAVGWLSLDCDGCPSIATHVLFRPPS